ncbi:hypothetical protein [Gloeocapsopsis sp. IPPAS B-1203]|uniref:hypothetical protein n=1 Tax=Gloeocapsopsis sp. IPPAS B-1203 TaxID=2049454 RepID=UPI000C19BE60|nr:hypothetical protein [Gloeocapsopsis sp. IPPAS B-1203]PIG92276.1 hypothetical protein CSQ79_16735 [Gloeocapsopsis sp. IPPAS B-1203]
MSVKACIYIGDLYGCSNEPFVYTFTPSTAIAVDDEVASLTVTAPAEGEVYIRKGAWLHFGANYIVVAKDTVITSVATGVDIEPATSAIAVSDTADTWGLQRVLASYIHSDESKFTVTTSDLESRGLGAIIHPASQSNQSIYTLIVQNSRHTFGRAQVGSLSYRDKSAKFEVFFQAPFGNAILFTAQSTYRQAQLNKLRQLAGLPVLVAQ